VGRSGVSRSSWDWKSWAKLVYRGSVGSDNGTSWWAVAPQNTPPVVSCCWVCKLEGHEVISVTAKIVLFVQERGAAIKAEHMATSARNSVARRPVRRGFRHVREAIGARCRYKRPSVECSMWSSSQGGNECGSVIVKQCEKIRNVEVRIRAERNTRRPASGAFKLVPRVFASVTDVEFSAIIFEGVLQERECRWGKRFIVLLRVVRNKAPFVRW
jgi:hypothetical protein